MVDRSMPPAPIEAPPPQFRAPVDPQGNGDPRNDVLSDPRAMTILTTEHWSLMAARGLVYNEAFARAGMFLAFLSATLVAMGLVATATGFSDAFLTVAAVVLALNLFVGLASLARIAAASGEDIKYLQGMNRLRHAYHEMAPELQRYFITSHFDDAASVLAFYGPAAASPIRSMLHGLTTTPGMVGAICSAVAGALAAVIAVLLTHDPVIAAAAGIVGFLAMFVILIAWMISQVRAGFLSLRAIFPRTDWDDDD